MGSITTESGKYKEWEEIVLVATPNAECIFIGWYTSYSNGTLFYSYTKIFKSHRNKDD